MPEFWYDKAGALIGALYLLSVLGSRWTIYTSTQRLTLSLTLPFYASFFILPHFFKRLYRRWRTPLVLVLRALLLSCRLDGKLLAHFQVRLNSPPRGAFSCCLLLMPWSFTGHLGISLPLLPELGGWPAAWRLPCGRGGGIPLSHRRLVCSATVLTLHVPTLMSTNVIFSRT